MGPTLPVDKITKFLGRKGYLFIFSTITMLLAMVFVVACSLTALKSSPSIADFNRLFEDFKDGLTYMFLIAVGGNGIEHITGIWKKPDGDQQPTTPTK